MAKNRDWFQTLWDTDLSSLQLTIASYLFSRSLANGDCQVSDLEAAHATKFRPETIRFITDELVELGWLERGDDPGIVELPRKYQLTIPQRYRG